MNKNKPKHQNIFGGLITSRTRIEILMRLFLNPLRKAYLRQLSAETGVSPSLIRAELQQLEESGLLKKERSGRQVLFCANTEHALFPELNSMVRKALGMDHILESIVERLGSLEAAWLIDDYAEGRDTGIIDLLLVGHLDQENLPVLVAKAEKYLQRKIRTLVMTGDERESVNAILESRPSLQLWKM